MKKSLTIVAAMLGLTECKWTSWTDDGVTCTGVMRERGRPYTGNVLYSTVRSARCSR